MTIYDTIREIERSSPEWRPLPGQLVSLWNMLRVQSEIFIQLMRGITQLELQLSHGIETAEQTLAQSRSRLQARLADQQTLADPQLLQEAKDLLDSPAKPLILDKSSALSHFLGSFLDSTESHCTSLNLDSGLAQIKRMRELLGSSVSFTAVQAALTSLAERIEDELRCRMFWFVPPDRVKFFDKEPPPFGNAVRDKFPEVAGDVLDASRSLGVGLPTGSVFYLMRVMEFGIRRLVKRLRVKPSKVKRKTWDGILKEINSAISSLSALPTLSAKRRAIRDVCAEATAHLNNVRIAWRNPVMHAERTYSPEEAAEVFDNVKAFMTYLATKVC